MTADLAIYQASAIQKLEAQVAPNVRKDLKESSKEFEAVFMAQMLKPMFEEINFNPMSGDRNSSQSDTYKGMLVDQMGKSLADHSGIGLAEPVYKTLLEAQVSAQQGQ